MTKTQLKGLTTNEPNAVAEGQLTYLRLRLAHTLRTLREQEGLTQGQLADRLGIKQAAVSKLESPYKNHDLETILRVFAALDVEFVAAVRDDQGLRPLTPMREEALVTVPSDIAEDAAERGQTLTQYLCQAADHYRDGYEYHLKRASSAPNGSSVTEGINMPPELQLRVNWKSPSYAPYPHTYISC